MLVGASSDEGKAKGAVSVVYDPHMGHVENGVNVKNEENNGKKCLSRTKYVY